jgi:hypothetical protein
MKLYTVAQYAKRCGISRMGVHDRIRTQKVIAFKVGDVWLIIKGTSNIKI